MKHSIKDNKFLIDMYIDTIRFGTSISFMATKLRPLLSRNFIFNIYGYLGNITGKKTDFARFMHSRQNFYKTSNPVIKFLNNKEVLVTFKNPNIVFKQRIYLENFKIEKIEEEDSLRRSKKKGGQGYTINPSINPVAGQPIVCSYYDCCRPIFFGSLMKGGKANSSYRFDLKCNHLNVLPQYRAIN